MKKNSTYNCLFPYFDWEAKADIAKEKAKERWKLKKSENLGYEYCNDAIFSGKYGITKLKSYTDELPGRFITLDDINNTGAPNVGVLGFSYDYKLTLLEEKAHYYIPILSRYKCLGEPDLSIKVGDPLGCAVANTVRSHNIAYRYQKAGCKIIPTMKWSDEASYDVCFSGYEKGGAVLVSTIGVISDERTIIYFSNGFKEMLKRISPDAVVLYGEKKEWMNELFPSQLEVLHIENERIKRMRRNGR